MNVRGYDSRMIGENCNVSLERKFLRSVSRNDPGLIEENHEKLTGIRTEHLLVQ
jgi:hypothetical protein